MPNNLPGSEAVRMRLPPLTLIGGPPSSQVRFHEHSVVNWKRVFFESFFEPSLSSTRVIRYPAIEDINTSQPRDPPSVRPTLSIDRAPIAS
jgi:hypothetical protein|uniref:Uncharacterized protein n=1 Tax=Picea glauca TaxID=3330 RepID=A0A101M5K9_PICGL|nr:hypothetical protein ABT39_MTgene1141 [Picea glauca]